MDEKTLHAIIEAITQASTKAAIEAIRFTGKEISQEQMDEIFNKISKKANKAFIEEYKSHNKYED
ncbi:MAG: hypothetical protein WC149_12130 [Arcobacteraceae bacterium]